MTPKTPSWAPNRYHLLQMVTTDLTSSVPMGTLEAEAEEIERVLYREDQTTVQNSLKLE